jgi:hypothetical protein
MSGGSQPLLRVAVRPRLAKIIRVRVVAAAPAGLALLARCSSGDESKSAIVNTIVLTRDDGSEIAVRGPVSVTCGPVSGDGPPALRVLVGRRTPGSQHAFWVVQVALADLKRKLTFRFSKDDVAGYAMFFAFDADGGRNELSSSEEEAGGRIALRKADCRQGVDFRIRAHLGSEFFDPTRLRTCGAGLRLQPRRTPGTASCESVHLPSVANATLIAVTPTI